MFNEFSRYEDEFAQWVKGGYPDAKPETLDYVGHLSDPGGRHEAARRHALAAPVGQLPPSRLRLRDTA